MCYVSPVWSTGQDLWPFYGFLRKRFSLYIKLYQGWARQWSGSTDPPKDVKRITALKKLLTLRMGDSLLLPLFSFSGIDVNWSKRLSPTPSVSNLSLRPCRYLSTVTRSSSQGSFDSFGKVAEIWDFWFALEAKASCSKIKNRKENYRVLPGQNLEAIGAVGANLRAFSFQQ